MRILKFERLHLPAEETHRTCIVVEDGRIRDLLTPARAAEISGAEVVDLTGAIGGPGLIDLHGITTFGVCAKPEAENPIGYFGTGLKYALAFFLGEGLKLEL